MTIAQNSLLTPPLADEIFVDRLLHKADMLTRGLRQCGYPMGSTSTQAKKHLMSTPMCKLSEVSVHFDFLASMVEQQIVQKKSDLEMTKKVLQRLKLSLSEAFMTTVGPDDVIELYNSDGIQIFRSFNMFRTTGYSLMDLNLFPWDHLWERTSNSSKIISQKISDVQNGRAEMVSFNIPEDIIKEILYTSYTQPFTPRMLSTRLGHLAALRCEFTNAIRGFAVTSYTQVLSVGREIENLHFI